MGTPPVGGDGEGGGREVASWGTGFLSATEEKKGSEEVASHGADRTAAGEDIAMGSSGIGDRMGALGNRA